MYLFAPINKNIITNDSITTAGSTFTAEGKCHQMEMLYIILIIEHSLRNLPDLFFIFFGMFATGYSVEGVWEPRNFTFIIILFYYYFI